MVNISQIVDESLARLGVEPTFDHLRLQWSRWFRCDSNFSVLLAPAKPGIFALAEEIMASENSDVGARASSPVQKRMLALFEIKETDDIGMALGRLFLPGNLLRDRLATGKCFARYTVIENPAERGASYGIFQRWMEESTGIGSYQEVA